MKPIRRIIITGGSGFIGTNLVELLRTMNLQFINLDIAPPLNPEHNKYWNKLDILDKDSLKKAFNEFQPDSVIDLAARTDVQQNTTVESDYYMNIDGVSNLIEVMRSCDSVVRAIFTSTQYVKRPGMLPSSDKDYDPHTVYGESKVRMEKLIHSSSLPFTWTIIRPTNVWGPWHLRYKDQLFKALKLGIYFHPNNPECVKSYAYVGNVVFQIFRILDTDPQIVNENTYYVGDQPLPQIEWVNEFSVLLSGRPVHIIPKSLMHLLGKIGDILTMLRGKEFLITSSRYKSMIENYLTPMDKTFNDLGPAPYSLSEGARLTIAWLQDYEETGKRDER